jgi:hypothetical protein
MRGTSDLTVEAVRPRRRLRTLALAFRAPRTSRSRWRRRARKPGLRVGPAPVDPELVRNVVGWALSLAICRWPGVGPATPASLSWRDSATTAGRLPRSFQTSSLELLNLVARPFCFAPASAKAESPRTVLRSARYGRVAGHDVRRARHQRVLPIAQRSRWRLCQSRNIRRSRCPGRDFDGWHICATIRPWLLAWSVHGLTRHPKAHSRC